MPAARFALAPMDMLMRGLTYFLWCLLLVLIGVAVVKGGGVALIAPMIMGTAFAGILIWMRPRAFILTGAGLRIEWPTRSLLIPRTKIVSAERIDQQTFGAEFGWPIRVGAGGFYGTFGYLWTSQGGFVDVEASRGNSGFVLIRTTDRPMLVTPDAPDRFVEAINRLAAHSS